MPRWPIGFSTGCFYRQPITDSLAAIRGHGFDSLEISSALTHFNYRDSHQVSRVAAQLQGLGFKVHSLHAPYAPELDISSLDPGVREASARELLLAAEAAGRLEAAMLVVHPGPERSFHASGEERGQRLHHTIEVLRRVEAACRDQGVRLLLENMLPLLIFGNTGDMLTMLEALEGRAGVCLDTGHAFLTGNIFHVISRLAPYLQMMHLHDNHGRMDDHFPPGLGHIHWPKVYRELDKIQFRGAMIMELIQPPDKSLEELLAMARVSREQLLSLEERLEQV